MMSPSMVVSIVLAFVCLVSVVLMAVSAHWLMLVLRLPLEVVAIVCSKCLVFVLPTDWVCSISMVLVMLAASVDDLACWLLLLLLLLWLDLMATIVWLICSISLLLSMALACWLLFLLLLRLLDVVAMVIWPGKTI